IYASIPNPNCKGLCVAACSTVPVAPLELEQLEAAAGRSLPTVEVGDDLHGAIVLGSAVGAPCPLLVIGRCSVYDARPMICRAFGAVDGLRCPHGCEPPVLLSDEEQRRNFARVAAL